MWRRARRHLRPKRRPRPRPDSDAARAGRRAPPAARQRPAHADRPGGRGGRRLGRAPHRRAHRLRRGCGVSMAGPANRAVAGRRRAAQGISRPAHRRAQLSEGDPEGLAEDHVQDGHLDRIQLSRRADLRVPGVARRGRQTLLRRNPEPYRRARLRRARAARARAARRGVRVRPGEAARLWIGALPPRRRAPRLGASGDPRHAQGSRQRAVRRLGRVPPLDAASGTTGRPARSARDPACRARRAARRGRALDRHRDTLRVYGHVARSAQSRGTRNVGRGHESPGRTVQFRRRWRGPVVLRTARRRRSPRQQDQTGRLSSLRRQRTLPGSRRRDGDQDGSGQQAWRRRSAAGPQGD